MSDKDNGGPAFPQSETLIEDGAMLVKTSHGGMTLRDAAALAALQGICAHNGSYGYKNGPSEISGRAWEIADAFIAERGNRK